MLAAALVVEAVTRNPPNYRYGTHRVWGDLEQSRYFDIDVDRDGRPHIGIERQRRATHPIDGGEFIRAVAACVPLCPPLERTLVAEPGEGV